MEKKDNVGAHHPDHIGTAGQREMFEDVCEGTLTLRAKRRKYLPQFPAESDQDYKFRCDTATFFNLTAKTVNVMTGLVFKEGVTLLPDVDPEIAAIAENIDNSGAHLDVFARKVFEEGFEGCSVILVDSPDYSADSRETQIAMGLRPYWIRYDADDAINWQYRVNPVSKRKELSLIVLRERSWESVGEFVSEEVTRYRVFRLDGQTVVWQLWREVKGRDGREEYELEGEGVLPNLTQIPVAVVGRLGAPPPLMDIALKNIEHFQTYSDYKSIVHKTCVPIPVGKGVELGGEEKVVVGASVMVQTSAEGDFGFAEVAGTSLEAVRQTLQDNRDDIALMGLSLLADKTARVDVTATEALLNNIGETAELRVMARGLQDAIELALGHTAEYLGKPRTAGGSIELGTAWNMQKDEFGLEIEELNTRADIANKLTGIVSTQWILRLLGVQNEEDINEILRQMRENDSVVMEDLVN